MQGHPVKYKKYHPNLKLAYAFGKEQELIPKPMQKQIPFSNVSRWRKQESSSDYFGQEVGLQIERCLDNGLTIENTPGLASVVSVYQSIFVFFHGLFYENNINLKKILFKKRQQIIDLIQKGTQSVSVDSALNAFNISRATYQNWLRDDLYKCMGSSFHLCLRRHPLQLSALEVKRIVALLQDIRYKHWPIEAIANYAKQQNILIASTTTFSKVKKWFKISRKRRRKPKKIVGVRAVYPNQIWHGDISVIRTTSALKFYLYMIIDNYSRKIINWRLETTKSGALWSQLLLNSCDTHINSLAPTLNFWTDDGSEVNNKVLTSTMNSLVIKHTIAQKDVPQSNSMIEAVFRIFKKNYMEYRFPDNLEELRSKVKWFVDDYNSIKPHSAHSYKRTPNQSFYNHLIDLESLEVQTKHALLKRKQFNKGSICKSCT